MLNRKHSASSKRIKKELKGKTIAVFGASSMIGGAFIRQVVSDGATVIAFARDTKKIDPYFTKNDNIKIKKGDITSKDDVYDVFRSQNIYASVNFITNATTDASLEKKVNVLGERYVLEASTKFRVKRHIYISTIATLSPYPNIYGNTKLEAEHAVKQMDGKIEWIILRYTHVLGSRVWGQLFKVIIPLVRVGIPKVPTDANHALFPYATMDTVVDATYSALFSRPNQGITVFDGWITLGELLKTMEKVHKVRFSFLPGKLINFLATYFGNYFPYLLGLSNGMVFVTHPPKLENKTMQDELGINPRNFKQWMKKRYELK